MYHDVLLLEWLGLLDESQIKTVRLKSASIIFDKRVGVGQVGAS